MANMYFLQFTAWFWLPVLVCIETSSFLKVFLVLSNRKGVENLCGTVPYLVKPIYKTETLDKEQQHGPKPLCFRDVPFRHHCHPLASQWNDGNDTGTG